MRQTTFLVDLDETLIHSTPRPLDVIVQYYLANVDRLPRYASEADYWSIYGRQITLKGQVFSAIPHPQALAFLQKLKERGDVFIFTAADEEYADTWANKFGFWDIIDGIYTTRKPEEIDVNGRWVLFDDTPAFGKLSMLPPTGKLIQLPPFADIHRAYNLLSLELNLSH